MVEWSRLDLVRAMTTIQRFEELLVWQRARELTRCIYRAFRDCRDMGFRDQIQRPAVSVMSNIAEGFESGTKQELLNYLYIAKASAGEVRAQLYAAHDIGYLHIETFKHLKGLAEECSKLLQSFSQKVKSGSRPGTQLKYIPPKDRTSEFLKRHVSPETFEKLYRKES
jgi:four helix bundle protein